MNRLRQIRNRELNSSVGSSINGYETANEDSLNSLYFSMSESEDNFDKTLEAQDNLIEPVTVKKSIGLISSPMTVIAAKLKDQQIGLSSTPQKPRCITEFPDMSGIQIMSEVVEIKDDSIIEIHSRNEDTKTAECGGGDSSVILIENHSVNSTQASNADDGPKILADFFANLDETMPSNDSNKEVGVGQTKTDDWLPQIVISEPSPITTDKENDFVFDFKNAVQKSDLPMIAAKLRDRGAIKKRLSVLTENRVASPIKKNNRKSIVKCLPAALKELRSKGAGDGPSNNLRSIIATVEPIAKLSNKSLIPPATAPTKATATVTSQSSRKSMIPPPSASSIASKNPQSNLKTRQSLLPPAMAAKVAQKPGPILKIPSKTTLADPKKRTSIGKLKIPSKTTLAEPKKRASIGKRRSTGERRSIGERRPTEGKTKDTTTLGKRKSTTLVAAPLAKTSRKTIMPPPKSAPLSTITFQCKKCPKSFKVESNLISHMRTHEPGTSQFKKDEPKCIYCDKKFQIQKALDTHLKEKCPKIPDLERKRLLYPKPHNQKSINSSSDLSTASTSSESNRAAPKSEKKRKTLSGITRTPSKKLTCSTCKKEFMDVILYSLHMNNHNNSATDDTD